MAPPTASSTTLTGDALIHHDTYYQATDDNDVINQESSSWQIAEQGQVGAYSRDGSIHATDETFNAGSHLAATMLSTLGTVLLIAQSSARSEPWKIVSFSIYGASLIFLFAMSSLHHAIEGKWEGFLRKMDYLAIYPLIAGTFTPVSLVFYHDDVIGWVFCGTVWGIALLNMVATWLYFEKIPRWLSTTAYVTLGWLGACMTWWLIPVLGYGGFAWFIVGGIFYTAGGYVYTTEAPNPVPGKFGFHEIWHVAVMLGAACHWMLMYLYVLPWEPNGDE